MNLRDCSEIREAARWVEVLQTGGRLAQPAAGRLATAHAEAPGGSSDSTGGGYLSDRITGVLSSMCRRGAFTGALVADISGLPLADHNCDPELMGACSSVLGDSLEQTARLLNQSDAKSIAIEINTAEKIVMHRFPIVGTVHYLMVRCSRNIDEKGEMELAIREIGEHFRNQHA